MSRADKVRVAIVGCGEHAVRNLLPSIASIGTFALVAAADLDMERATLASNQYGAARAYADYQIMLDREHLDALVLCGPPDMHYKVASEAIARGLHVFVEKPPTWSTKELHHLAVNAKEHCVVTAVGHNFRYAEPYQVMNRIVSGEGTDQFGKLVNIDMVFLSTKPRRPLWGKDSVIRSFLLAMALHPVEIMISQFGLPISTTVNAHFHGGSDRQRVSSPAMESETMMLLMINVLFGDRRVATLVTGNCSDRFKIDIRFTSDSGKLLQLDDLWRLTYEGGGVSHVRGSGLPTKWSLNWTPSPLDSGHVRSGYAGELAAFATAVITGGRTHPSFAEEVAVYDVVDAIERDVAAQLMLVTPL